MAYPNIYPMIPTLHPNYNDSTQYVLYELRETKRQLIEQIEVLSQRIAAMELWSERLTSDGK
jgi:hypothetical protein